MSAQMRSLEVVLLAAVALGSLAWEWRLWRRDCRSGFPPRRLYIPLALSSIVFIGFVIHAFLSLSDPRKPSFNPNDCVSLLFRAIVFALVLNVKTLLGPLFVGYSFGSAIYCYFEYAEWNLWPYLDVLFDWVFDGSPYWLKYTYLSMTFAYAFVTSVFDEGAIQSIKAATDP